MLEEAGVEDRIDLRLEKRWRLEPDGYWAFVFEFLNATLSPSEFVRYKDSNGQVTAVGAKYPQIQDFSDSYDAIDTTYWVQNGVEFFEYVDRDVFNGVAYFYSVTATDFVADTATGEAIPIGRGLSGDPQSNFDFAVPRFAAQTAEQRDEQGQNIFVFPNPATATPARITQVPSVTHLVAAWARL